MEDRPKVKQGFTKALTRSAKDQEFRDRLLDFANQEKVKGAVQEELNKAPGAENMVIPTKSPSPHSAAALHSAAAALTLWEFFILEHREIRDSRRKLMRSSGESHTGLTPASQHWQTPYVEL
jgi:hypothetical protein